MAVQRSTNVRPRAAEYEDDLAEADRSISESGDGESESNSDGKLEDPSMSEDAEESEGDDSEDGGGFDQKISNVSFGALKQAQDAISRKRKRGSDTTPDQDDKLAKLRERLRQIKEQKSTASASSAKEQKRKANSHQKDEVNSAESDSDSDSGPSEEDVPSKSRTSKHAPAAMSSKYQVTRKRQVVDVPKRVVRDPRFDALHQSSAHPGNSEKAYSFLEDYQKSEIAELKAAIKQTKNEEDKDILRRKVGSMENKLKAKAAKEREQEIIRRHRKEERERIEQGKNPYYLKKKDVKEKALVEKFKGMKSKEREKLLDKRRKKEGQKEKKRMPDARRMAG